MGLPASRFVDFLLDDCGLGDLRVDLGTTHARGGCSRVKRQRSRRRSVLQALDQSTIVRSDGKRAMDLRNGFTYERTVMGSGRDLKCQEGEKEATKGNLRAHRRAGCYWHASTARSGDGVGGNLLSESVLISSSSSRMSPFAATEQSISKQLRTRRE